MANQIGIGLAGRLAYYAVNGTDLAPTSSKIAIDNTNGIVRLVDGRLEITRTSTVEGLVYSAHHATANSNALTFIRTRGTAAAQTAVASGDVLGKLLFIGHDGTVQQPGGYIVTTVDGTVSSNNMSTAMVFGVKNGATLTPALQLTKTGQSKTNSIANLSGTDLTLTSTGTLTLSPTGKVVLGAPAKLTITGGTSGQALTTDGAGNLSWTTITSSYSLPTASSTVLGGIKVGSGLSIDGTGVLSATGSGSQTPTFTTVTTTTLNVKDVNFTGTGAVSINSNNDLNLNATGNINIARPLYANDVYSNGVRLTPGGATNLDSLTDVQITSPTAGQVLKYNGTAWINDTDATGGSGAGLPSRTTKSGTVNSLATNSSANLDITAFKGFALYKIQVSSPAWVTVYNSSTARTADASRLQSTDPLPSAGVLAEVVTSSNNETLTFGPALHCYNDDATVGTTIYLKVKNLSGSTANITVTLTVLQTEA